MISIRPCSDGVKQVVNYSFFYDEDVNVCLVNPHPPDKCTYAVVCSMEKDKIEKLLSEGYIIISIAHREKDVMYDIEDITEHLHQLVADDWGCRGECKSLTRNQFNKLVSAIEKIVTDKEKTK